MMIIVAIVKLLIILCIVATIHEFGHFLAAKFFKIGVNEFSIGFGPKIFQKKKNDTMYSLRWIPLGGYVMIEGEGEVSDKENSFDKKHPFKRIVVLTMGVIFNLILGFLVLVSVYFFVPVYTTQIESLAEDSVLIEAGIIPGDRICKIDGKKVVFANELVMNNFSNSKLATTATTTTTTIEYERNGQIMYTAVNGASKKIGYAGISFKVNEEGSNVVDYVQKGYAAEKSGIKNGDKIIKIDEEYVTTSQDIIAIIQKSLQKELKITVLRNEKEEVINMLPDERIKFDLGILETTEEKPNIYFAVSKAIKTIFEVANSYAELFKGKVGINDVSSIVGIGVVVSKTNGILEYLNMLAIISLAVGAANILPFVPLDGGKIVFVIYEWITKKKPSEKFEVITSYIGWGALMLLTIIVTFKDVISMF